MISNASQKRRRSCGACWQICMHADKSAYVPSDVNITCAKVAPNMAYHDGILGEHLLDGRDARREVRLGDDPMHVEQLRAIGRSRDDLASPRVDILGGSLRLRGTHPRRLDKLADHLIERMALVIVDDDGVRFALARERPVDLDGRTKGARPRSSVRPEAADPEPKDTLKGLPNLFLIA